MKLMLGRVALPLISVLALYTSASAAQMTVCINVVTKEWKRVEPTSTSHPSESGEALAQTQLPQSQTRTAVPTQPALSSKPATAGSANAPVASGGDAAASGAGQPGDPVNLSRPRAHPPETLAIPTSEIDPTVYLKRMLEYEVTHEPGFAAVQRGCAERFVVELYPLDEGWTVFARYSGNEREEKVDRVRLDEFVALSQRVARALLHDKPISATVNRENVLRADSQEKLLSMQGRHHVILGLGTMLRVGMLDTAQEAGAPAQEELRFATPLSLQVGSRYKLRGWGLDAFIRVNVGTSTTSSADNLLGGHVDYAGGGGVGLRFLRYLDEAGISSLYYGVGADFELAVFRGIEPGSGTTQHDEELVGGGLSLGAMFGHEFLRSSATHFFVQAELIVPTYVYDVSDRYTEVHTWFPGTVAIVGMAL